MKISLLVLRCQDIEISKDFYQLLGLTFVKEKHGSGPAHYSCEYDGCVFELYPNKGEPPEDRNRLGFKVLNRTEIINNITVTDSYDFLGNTIIVVTDPDGRKVELSE
ncbi:VOC family protein [Marinomonas transparens]|uniref:VOC family protein n=1 Tax=Marinomonas transparens TaxID=2795388 RepID=A0A934JZF1_9GAMM|nr:VOC family protein [Marinomonas transparens]MBJ7539712.1 VOC family protein [Marinomonas transparens]